MLYYRRRCQQGCLEHVEYRLFSGNSCLFPVWLDGSYPPVFPVSQAVVMYGVSVGYVVIVGEGGRLWIYWRGSR